MVLSSFAVSLVCTMMNSLPHLRRAATLIARRSFASDSGASSNLMKLNFNIPQEALYSGTPVKSVVVPGAMGEYEVTAEHVPIVAELKAGILTINHEGGEMEKYFVAGGFSLTHDDSVTDIVCPEAVKLDDIDSAAVQKNYDSAKSKFSAAETGSSEAAEAMIEVEVNRAMGSALGLSLA